MKHSVPARSFASLVVIVCLLAAPVAVLAKKGEKNFKRGVEHEKAQQWERAAQEFALAVAANPSEMEFQLHYRRALFNASQKFMEQGRTLADQGDYRGAYNAYRQAYGYDPVNELAVAEMERMLRLQREREGATGNGHSRPGGPQTGNGNGNGAAPVPTSYDAASGATVAARAMQQPRPGAPQQPLPSERQESLRVINYNGDLEGFIRKMAEELGLNVLTDRDFPKRTININLKNVTAARALDFVFVAHGLMFQRLDRRTILVADQTKRGQYQQLVLRTFYLQNIDPNDARTLINASLPPNAGRQPVVTPNKATNSITVRDTAENIRLIEDLLAAIDKDRAEVVMDVSIYEVSRTDLLQLGNQVGDASTLGSLGGLNPLQILVGGPNGRGGVVTGTGTGTGKGGDSGGKASAVGDAVTTAATAALIPTAIGGAFVLPATRLSIFQSKENTRLLAHTQVHAFDGEQSSTRIGQKVPIQTAQVTPFGGIGGTTTPQQGATTGLFGGNGFPVIQYQDTGLILKFTPQVFPNQDVQVKMEIESNDVIGGGSLTPTFSQRSVSGMARIPNNRTMMIASVAQDRESRGRQGLPLLGLVPILGRLFTTPTRNDSNNDIVITVTPRVLRAPVVTPEDIEIRPSGTLQSPVTSTLEAIVREAEREEQLAAARQLPTNAAVEVPTAASVETASLHHAPATKAAPAAQNQPAAQPQPAETEQHAFVPAPKILAGAGGASAGGMTAVNNFAPAATSFAPAVYTEDPPPPAANKPATAAAPAAANTTAAANTVPAATTLNALAPQAELYVVAGQTEMRVGTRQRLMVFVKTPTPLALAAATLKFDPKVVAVRSVVKGSLFAEGAPQPSVTQSVDQSGSLLALVAPAAGAPVTGMGVLLFVEIEALKAGETSVGFDHAGVHLMSADGRSLPAQGSQIRLAVKR